MANIIQLATQDFCDRFVDYNIDPCRRLYDQMVLAARCGTGNIPEGSARHSTSVETEMRLLDVARASFDEVQGDFFNFLLRKNADVWPIGNPHREAIWQTRLDPPQYSNDYLHDAAIHIRNQKRKFDYWLENDDPVIVANAVLVLLLKENKMLQSQLQTQLDTFRQTGGFTENMTAERLEARKAQGAAANVPNALIAGSRCSGGCRSEVRVKGASFGDAATTRIAGASALSTIRDKSRLIEINRVKSRLIKKNRD